MTHASASPGEGKNITDEVAAAASDIAGQLLRTNVHEELPGASGPPDDLLQLKGVGPKLATLLNERGINRFDQIAKLSEGQVETIDASLGAFRGRLERDRIVEQADYLSRGDIDGYEARFGKL
jgi:predicted flap endonuclease-1-like 5' DNA nuclease